MNGSDLPRFDHLMREKMRAASLELFKLAIEGLSQGNHALARELFSRLQAYDVYEETACLGISLCEAAAGNFDLSGQALNESQIGRPANLRLPAGITSLFPRLDADQQLWTLYLFTLLQPWDETGDDPQPLARLLESKLCTGADQKLTGTLELLGQAVTIRIGKVYNPEIIGNFSNATDIYLRKRQLAPPSGTLDVFLAESPPVNAQLMKMFRRKMQIVQDPFLLAIYEHSGTFRRSAHFIPELINYSNEYEVFTETKPAIEFTPDEESRGKDYLAQLGLGPGDWFVCLFSRDPAFKKSQFPAHSFITEDHRNSDINRFSEAVSYIIEKGGYVVRMGSVVAQDMELRHPRLIDYPNSPLRNEFLDVYLAARCRFFLGTTSGICDLSFLFGVPNLRVNFTPPGGSPWGRDCLFIPKKIRSRLTGRLLGFPHLIGQFPKATTTMWNGLTQRETFGYLYEENSAQEILEVTKEMFQRIEGTFSESADSRILQEQYRDLFPPGHWSFGNKTPMGRDFLKNNRELLAAGTGYQCAADQYRQATSLVREGKHHEAAAAYLALLDWNPHHGEALQELGELYRQQRDVAKAVNLFNAALQVNSDCRPALLGLADLCKTLGRPGEAKEFYRHCLMLNPADSVAKASLAGL
jgi:putative glycosyltransferase (TIGR04372 family)